MGIFGNNEDCGKLTSLSMTPLCFLFIYLFFSYLAFSLRGLLAHKPGDGTGRICLLMQIHM